MVAMAAILYFTVALCAIASVAEGGVLFASLNKTLAVTYQIESSGSGSAPGVARAGVDSLRIHWVLNSSFTGRDANYKKVNLKLCYAPPSQHDRGWRKTRPDISLDRTCKAADIATQEYTKAGSTTTWLVKRDVPKAIYFVRAYAENDLGVPLAFGQTTDKNRTRNLFSVEPITGRHKSIEVAAALFSAFAVGSLLAYLGLETLLKKRKGST